MAKIKRIFVAIIVSFFLSYSLFASAFVVRSIRIEGLQRIPRSTVLNYLPVREGQELTDTAAVLQTLYKTGFFSDISLGRQGNDLIISVVERPVIGAIRISGNKEIKTPDLMTALKKAGIGEGLSYDSSIIEAMKKALEQQYNSQGRYAAQVNVTTTTESQNRLGININIVEGKVSKIKNLHIVGNKDFSESKLLSVFESSKTKPWSFFTANDQYVKEKLEGDLDKLRAFYMDRGYLKFKILDTKTSMGDDKKKVMITVTVEEGPIYKVKGHQLNGQVLPNKAVMEKLILVKDGEVFSRKAVVTTRELLNRYLANQGYAFADVNIVPTVDDVNHTVFLTFDVSPGKRTYVRRIGFTGHYKTTDEVLRRELRQMEGALYSASNVEESKRRLSNLGYLQNVQVKTVPTDVNPQLVDLEYQVTEISSASANFQLGYSDAYGLLYGANFNQTNFLGTGRHVNASFQANDAATNISLAYYNPYYTMSGIGRGFSVYSQYATPAKIGITPFRMNTYGAAMKYDIPISEYGRLNLSFGYDNIKLFTHNASDEIEEFVDEHGTKFDQFRAALGWSRSTYDRAIFPTCGWKQYLGAEVGLPFAKHSIDYFKINYDTAIYYPLYKNWIFHFRGNLGYGNGYAEFDELPFFKNYYAGGIDSVRGYEDNTLGPRDSHFNPIGGNVLTVGSLSLIFPNPFPEQLRTSIFVDAGNVFHNDIGTDRSGTIRTATGIQFEWLSPMGPIHFSFSKALNPGKYDETRVFQFSLGASF